MSRIFSYKIKLICTVWLTTVILFSNYLLAQDLHIVKKNKTYCELVQLDSFQKMISINSLIPNAVYDLRYATKNNFTGQQLYGKNVNAFLRISVIKALQNVQQELETKGYGLKIFDAYRPYSVTKKMWDLIHDERYVANPAKGSGHNRGLAVDLTIVDLKTGNELNMGTGFDNFTDTAHHNFTNLSSAILQNRSLLRQTMEKYGFRALETEWWHYSWLNDRNYEVLDIDLKKFKKCPL